MCIETLKVIKSSVGGFVIFTCESRQTITVYNCNYPTINILQ